MPESKVIPDWFIHQGRIYSITHLRTAKLPDQDWLGDESNGLAAERLASTERPREQSPNGKPAIIDVSQMSDLEFAAYLSTK